MGSNTTALLALIVPLIVAVLTTTKSSSLVKGSLAFAFSIAVGILSVWSTGAVVLEEAAGTLLVVIAAAQGSYAMFWKPLGVTSWIMEHLGRTA